MRAPKSTSRTQIVQLLKRSDGLTVQQLSKQLGITSVAARKHLASLAAENLVATRRQSVPRGRPTIVYVLTATAERLFPQSYDRLAVDLLEDLSALAGEEQLQRLFQARNERLAHTYQIRLVGKPFVEQVQELVHLRDEEGYMASVAERDGALIIAEHNCPIHDVAQRFPHACQCEQELFARLLNRKVELEASVLAGDNACRYRVEP